MAHILTLFGRSCTGKHPSCTVEKRAIVLLSADWAFSRTAASCSMYVYIFWTSITDRTVTWSRSVHYLYYFSAQRTVHHLGRTVRDGTSPKLTYTAMIQSELLGELNSLNVSHLFSWLAVRHAAHIVHRSFQNIQDTIPAAHLASCSIQFVFTFYAYARTAYCDVVPRLLVQNG